MELKIGGGGGGLGFSVIGGLLMLLLTCGAEAWTGEIHGRVLCDVCGDSTVGPEDHALEGAEVAVLCITKSGEVLNYQAFTNPKGRYTVAETMPESERWVSCLARPMSSFDEHCARRSDVRPAAKIKYDLPSGYFRTVRPFLYKTASVPTYCA